MRSSLKLSPASCAFYPGRPGMVVLEDFLVHLADGRQVKVPAGFWTNGGSIPALFWQLTFSPFDPRILPATTPHDYLYTGKFCSREVADATLFEYLKQNEGVWFKSWMVHAAVRCFGRWAWKESPTDAAYRMVLREQLRAAGKDLAEYGMIE